YDPNPAADDLEARIFTPDRDVQALFDRFSYLTRLFTAISPAEMNIDPIFSMRDNLPIVGNDHTARLHYECGNDGNISNARVHVELDDGTVFYVNARGEPEAGPQPA